MFMLKHPISLTGRGVLMALLSVLLCLLSCRCADAYAAASPQGWHPVGMSQFVQDDDPINDAFGDFEGFDKSKSTGSTDIVSTLAGMRKSLVKVMEILLAICSLAVLTGAILNLTSGDQGAAKRLGSWFVGFAVGLAIFHVIGNLELGVKATGADGLDGLRHDVGALMEELVLVIGAITLVSATLQLMRGEQGAAEKMVKWLITLSVGFVLLDLVAKL